MTLDLWAWTIFAALIGVLVGATIGYTHGYRDAAREYTRRMGLARRYGWTPER